MNWVKNSPSAFRTVSHCQGSWRWQLRAQRVEYRLWKTADNRLIWRSYHVHDNKVSLGNIKGNHTVPEESLHNKPATEADEYTTWERHNAERAEWEARTAPQDTPSLPIYPE